MLSCIVARRRPEWDLLQLIFPRIEGSAERSFARSMGRVKSQDVRRGQGLQQSMNLVRPAGNDVAEPIKSVTFGLK